MEQRVTTPVLPQTELEKMRALADRLSFADLVQGKMDGFAIYECAKGTCFGQRLLHMDDIAVQNTFASTGTEFAEHVHCVLEIVVVYKGKMVLTMGNEKIGIGRKDSITIKPNMPHSAFFPIDTWLICITIPADEGYP